LFGHVAPIIPRLHENDSDGYGLQINLDGC
jgi:hypothetical protein